MLRVWGSSGQELAALSAEEFINASAVKQHLSKLHGLPACLQQLVHDGEILADDDKLDAGMELQLVLLTISGHSQRFTDAAIQHLANAARQNQVDAVRCLLEAGIGGYIDHQYPDGKTSLSLASRYGHSQIARLLVEAGADKDCRDRGGKTALMHACEHGHFEAARLLVKTGADKDCSNNDGWTALMYASASGYLQVACLLVGAGADKDCQDRGGKTALMHASERGHLEVAKLLVGANKDCSNNDGKTALMYASVSGHLGVARLLLQAGAGKDARDGRGFTALLLASECGHLGVARLLLEAGADKDVEDLDGKTALMRASESGHLEIVSLLLTGRCLPHPSLNSVSRSGSKPQKNPMAPFRLLDLVPQAPRNSQYPVLHGRTAPVLAESDMAAYIEQVLRECGPETRASRAEESETAALVERTLRRWVLNHGGTLAPESPMSSQRSARQS